MPEVWVMPSGLVPTFTLTFAEVGGDVRTTGLLRYLVVRERALGLIYSRPSPLGRMFSQVEAGDLDREEAVSPMRVYIPATLAMLRMLVEAGELVPVSGIAFALTPMLRESYAAGDTEELEYAAMNEAARASLRLLAAELDGDPATLPRRVVVAADVAQVRLRPDLDDAAVTVTGAVPASAVAAVHVDVAEAEDAVRTAVSAVDAADLGDPDAEFALGDAEDHDMAWYATQEIPFLLELL